MLVMRYPKRASHPKTISYDKSACRTQVECAQIARVRLLLNAFSMQIDGKFQK